MADMENRTTEHEMALAVMIIAESKPSGCATLDELRERIEESDVLTDEDWEPSDSQGSPKWHQILRNINCNRKTGENAIKEGYLEHLNGGGYCITEQGRALLATLRGQST